MSDKRRCKGTNKRGEPCQANPLRGRDHCSAHDPNLPESSRFGSHAQAAEAAKLAGRPPKPRPTDIARKLAEDNVRILFGAHYRALGYEIVDSPDGLQLQRTDGGGAKLHGISAKDGFVFVSDHDDLGAQVNVAEKLQDRFYGKPKQQTEISGPDQGPLVVQSGIDLSKLSVDEKRALLQLMEKASGPPIG